MKRSSDNTEVLVYAYGCGFPAAGLHEALAEETRCRILWDKLVGIDRMAERCLIDAACLGSPEFRALNERLESIHAELGPLYEARNAARKMARRNVETLEDAPIAAFVAERRTLWPQYWAALKTWRLANKDRADWIECERRRLVVEARQTSGLYWGNYNRVLDSYDRARTLCRKTGRRLRERDPERDDGCLAVQIQRVGDTLGASPMDLMTGRIAALQIGTIDPRAYDPLVPRGERKRLSRTTVEMRVDAEGHMIRLPITMHRSLPIDCRVKSVQLTRRGRDQWKLCLTITRPRREIVAVALEHTYCGIDLGWRQMQDGSLRVAMIADGHEPRQFVLPPEWMCSMDRVERLQSRYADLEIAQDKRQSDELRTRMLGRRLEHYRLLAREIAMTHRVIAIDSSSLAKLAKRENSDLPAGARVMRQRAGLSYLVQELRHQCAKHGARLIEVEGASTMLCHICGGHTEPQDRSDMFWRCHHCDALWDQDANAALNLLAYAIANASGQVVKDGGANGINRLRECPKGKVGGAHKMAGMGL